MSDRRNGSGEPMWNGVPEEERVRRLLEEAGPRTAVADDDFASAERAARQEWRRLYGRRRRPAKARWLWMAAAAALVAAAGLFWLARTPVVRRPYGGTPAASVERVVGTAWIAAPGARQVRLSGAHEAGFAIPSGSRLETAAGARAGRVSIRMSGGASVRLDAATRAVLFGEELLELERGAIYVDTGAERERGREITVDTWAGVFSPTGTQFEVRIEPGESSARLRVREGTVSLAGGEEDATAAAGQELILRADGHLTRGLVSTSGPDWDWVLQAAPMLDIEGVRVKAFLDWVAREAGWQVELADPETASRVESTVLHGSIDHLTPAEAPGVILASCGLAHRVSDGRIVVFLAEEKR